MHPLSDRLYLYLYRHNHAHSLYRWHLWKSYSSWFFQFPHLHHLSRWLPLSLSKLNAHRLLSGDLLGK